MREIKFDFMYQHPEMGNICHKHYYLEQLMDRSLPELCDIHGPYTLIAKRQYTGLKDKNGVEIYEDDILDIKYNYLGKVAVIFKRGEYNISRYNLDKCKVIGNIHENPELLGQNND